MSRKNKYHKKNKKKNNYYYVDQSSTNVVSFSKKSFRTSTEDEMTKVAFSIFGSEYYCVGDQCLTT